MSITLTLNSVDVEIDESDLEEAIESYLESNEYMTHTAVTDTVEEYVKDNLDISGEVESALEGMDYQTSSDVSYAIEQAVSDFMDREDVRKIVRDEMPDEGLSDDDVERIALEVAERRDNELERRVDQYAQRVDELRGMNLEGIDNRLGLLEQRTSEPVMVGLVERIEELERKLEASAIIDGAVIDTHTEKLSDLDDAAVEDKRKIEVLDALAVNLSEDLRTADQRIATLEATVMRLVQANAAQPTHAGKAEQFYSLVKQAYDLLRS